MDVGPYIGPYRVVRQLGSGGFATVWLAADELLDAPVAIKLLAEQWIGRDDIRAKFINEARLLRRLDDDRVVRVYAVDELVHGRPYFVMAWADRGTLGERLSGDPMHYSLEGSLRIAAELAECMVLVHSYGIVHRDIKPSNILFRSRPAQAVGEAIGAERLLLGDFGVATVRSEDPRLTGPVGTPAYMAPEQAVYSDGIDARADIFAATAVLYELAAGHPAFETRTPAEAGRPFPLEPISATRPDAPASLQELVEQGLSVSPQDRFQSAVAFAAAIRRELQRIVQPDRRPLGGATGAQPAPAEASHAPVARIEAGHAVEARAMEADPAEAVAVLVDHGASLLPDLVTQWDRARSVLRAPFRVVAVADEGARDLLAARPLARADVEVSIHEPADLEHQDNDFARYSDVLVVAVPDDEAGRVLELLRIRLAAPAAYGPVCLLSVQSGASWPPAGSRLLPSATFDRSEAGAAALWERVAGELAGWGTWARAEEALEVVSLAFGDAGAEPGGLGARRDLRDHMESLRLAQPRLAEVALLRSEASGKLALAAQLRSELRLVLGPGAIHRRLGLQPEATPEQLLEAARKGGERWRALMNTGGVPFSARPAAMDVARAYDRLWAAIG